MKFILYKITCLTCIQFLYCLSLHAGPDPPIRFIENKNQWPEQVHFSARVPGGYMFIEPGKFTYRLLDESAIQHVHRHEQAIQNESDGKVHDKELISGHSVRVTFSGANATVRPHPFGKLAAYYNYFIGSDCSRWASKASSYNGMLYPSLYPGINLKVYSIGNNVKYDLIIAPGENPSQIRMKYEGVDRMYIDNGDLFLKTSVADIIEKRPYAYQVIDGMKREVQCMYLLVDNTISFLFPERYDTCHELVIDPVLIFSTYSGSTADNWGSSATPGEHGNLYSAGVTREDGGTFPATPGAFQTSSGGLYDVAILKYDSLGSNLLYASYLGGNESEMPHSLIMNPNEELVILGTTSSDDFPTTENAHDRDFNGGNPVEHAIDYNEGSDIFLTRISKDGSQVLASTYLGGSGNDGLSTDDIVRNYGDELRGDVITDNDGNIYISSVTSSSDFTTTFSLGMPGGPSDALLVKLNSELQIIWSALIGGGAADASHTIKLDSIGNFFMAGGTMSSDFPVTSASHDPSWNGGVDGWIAKIDKSGSSILDATYTGTDEYDQVFFLDLNKKDEVFVYGQTTAGDSAFVSRGIGYGDPNSGQFIQKFSNDLSTLFYSTAFGSGRGEPDISPTAFLVNECDNLYMAGWGASINQNYAAGNTIGLRVTDDAIQKTTGGSDFYFIVLAKDASRLLYATFFGGGFSETHVDGGTSRFDKEGVVYHAVCAGCGGYSDFPATPGAWSTTNNSLNCNNAAFKFDLVSLKSTFSTGNRTLCIPDAELVFKNESVGGTVFEWDFGDGSIITRTDTSSVTYEYKSPGTYMASLKVTDIGTCQVISASSATISVYARQSVVQDDDVMCGRSSYTLKASGGLTYQWRSFDSLFTAAVSSPLVTPQRTTSYYVRIVEPTGCIVQDTVQIRVVPPIDVDFDFFTESQCVSRPVLHVTDSTQAAEDAQMIFDFGDGSTSDFSEVTHEYAVDGAYYVKLIGVRESCVYEKGIEVNVYSLKVPNIITPGRAEGQNDAFIIGYGPPENDKTPSDYGLKVSLVVYNRWGKKVFEDHDYKHNWSGEDLASGIYYYEVTVEGYTSCRSWVHVLK